MEMMQEAAFYTPPVTLNYAEGPTTGPALVLIYGGSALWQYFTDIIPDLANHWHLFALDLRGHGKSGRVAGGYALQDYAGDLAAFLQEVSGPAFLFGHSLGGCIALFAAANCPDLVRGVIVGDSPLDSTTFRDVINRSRERIRTWQELAGGSRSVEEIYAVVGIEELSIRLYHNDSAMLAMLLDDQDRLVDGYEMDIMLPAVRCPVLLLQADPGKGAAMSTAEVDRALQLFPNARHKQFTGLSHLLYIEDKDAVLREIEEFLRNLPMPGGLQGE